MHKSRPAGHQNTRTFLNFLVNPDSLSTVHAGAVYDPDGPRSCGHKYDSLRLGHSPARVEGRMDRVDCSEPPAGGVGRAPGERAGQPRSTYSSASFTHVSGATIVTAGHSRGGRVAPRAGFAEPIRRPRCFSRDRPVLAHRPCAILIACADPGLRFSFARQRLKPYCDALIFLPNSGSQSFSLIRIQGPGLPFGGGAQFAINFIGAPSGLRHAFLIPCYEGE